MRSPRAIWKTGLVGGLMASLALIGALSFHLQPAGSSPAPAEPTPQACCRQPQSTTINLHGAPGAADHPADLDPVFGEFRAWVDAHTQSTPDSSAMSPAELARGVELAERRRPAMAHLMATDPQQALTAAIPGYLAKRLPAAVATRLERPVSARGDFVVTERDFFPDLSREPEIKHTVQFGSEKYQAFVYGRRQDQTTKFNIPLNGIVLDGMMAVDENPIRKLPPAEIAQLDRTTHFTNKNDQCPTMPERKVPGVTIFHQAQAAQAAVAGAESGAQAEQATTTIPGGDAAQATQVVEVGGELTQLCCPACSTLMNDQLTAALNGSDPTSGEGDVPLAASSYTTGTKTVLVIYADTTDVPNANTPAFYQNYMDTVVSPFYFADSYGQLNMITTVTTLVHLPNTKAFYEANGGAAISDGYSAAIAAGWAVDNYDFYVVAPSCSAGIGRVGAPGCACGPDLGAACHELGHNLGVWHANGWATSDGSVIGSGRNNEYSNFYSVMGGSESGAPKDHDGWMKNKLGWLPATNITTVTTSGTYTMYALDDAAIAGANKYALKLHNPTHSNDYWIQLREQQTSTAWIQNGIEILWSPWGTIGASTTTGSNRGTQVLDMFPGSGSGILDTPLLIGRTFSDRVNGFYITPISRTGSAPTQAQVVINIGAFPGNRAPTVTLTPTMVNTTAGTAVNFSATASDPDGDTLAYAWDFGDKAFGTNSASASHSWAVDGQYVVSCTVSDMKGGETAVTALVTVGSPATFTIAGTILDSGGQPVKGAIVQQYLIVGAGVKMVLKSTTTSSDGKYTLVGFNAGTYNIDAVLGNYTFAPSFSNPVAVGPSATGKDFTATPITYAVTGTVTDGGGSPMAGVTVSNGTVSAATDAAGNYTLNLMEGLYILTPNKAGYTFAPVSRTVTVAGAAVGSNDFTATAVAVNAAPTVATPANATPNPVTGTTTNLSVLGADDGGEPALKYTWASAGPAAVTFSANGTNAAKNATATFTQAGSYSFTVTILDTGGKTVTSTIGVTVNQTLTTITVAPASASVLTGGTQSFTATGKDQYAMAMAPAPVFTWTVSGGGTISAAGLFTAGGVAGGPYTVTATSGAKSGTAQVTVTAPVNQPPVIDSGASATPNPVVGATTTSVSVTAHDPDAGPAALTYTWSKVSGPGSVTFAPNGTTSSDVSTATFGASGTYTLQVTVSDGAASVSSQIVGLTVTLPNGAPTVATAASAVPSPVTGSTTALSVLGADDGGEPALKYTWASVGPAAVTYSVNGTNAAKNATATFTKAGSYTFTVTLQDAGGLTVTSSVAVTVNQTLTTLTVTPNSAAVQVNLTQSFAVAAQDQFAAAMAAPAIVWSVSGGGTISAAGLFTAGAVTGGPFTVTATGGGKSGTAQVTVTSAPNAAPTVATAASASPNLVNGTSTTLSVLGADDGGEPALKYTWASVGPAAVTYSANGTNGAKNATATFTKAGSYTFTVTILDGGGLTVTSSVAVTVNQKLTTATVTPGAITIAAGSTQSFTVAGKDQFGTGMLAAPVFTWTISGGGTISAAGLFSAEPYAGGPYTVTATSGAVSATASVTLTGGSNPVTSSTPTISLTATTGSVTPVSATVQLTNASSSPVTVTVSDGQVWLSATPGGPTAIPAGGSLTITVTADPSGLNGTFNGTVTIVTNPSGLTQTLAINFTVNPAPAAAAGTGKKGGCALADSGNAWSGELWLLALGLVGLLVSRRRNVRSTATGR